MRLVPTVTSGEVWRYLNLVPFNSVNNQVSFHLYCCDQAGIVSVIVGLSWTIWYNTKLLLWNETRTYYSIRYCCNSTLNLNKLVQYKPVQ
jgi:hypothetical protein